MRLPGFAVARRRAPGLSTIILLMAIVVVLPMRARADESSVEPRLRVGAVPGSPFCAGWDIGIPFTVTGLFDFGNVFTAELSDSSGSFASPIRIGTMKGRGSGVIQVIIPASVPYGTRYRVRVVSSSPARIAEDNGERYTIRAARTPAVTVEGSLDLCRGGSVVLDAGPGFLQYLWSTGEKTRSIVVTTPGWYGVLVRDSLGCEAHGQQLRVRWLNVAPSPTIVRNGSLLMTYAARRYQWNFDGEPLPGDTSQFCEITNRGTYTVTTWNDNGCVATSQPFIVESTASIGVTGSGDPIGLRTEAGGRLFLLRARMPGVGSVDATVVDVTGREVLRPVIESGGAECFGTVDLTGHPAGAYFLWLRRGSDEWVRGIVTR